MSDKDRNKSITDLIRAGDSESLAAVLNAPAVLTGITADIQASYREKYEEANVPILVKQRANALQTIGDLNAALNTAVQSTDNLVDDERMAEIDREIEAAEDAGTQFTDSFKVNN